jgi:Asp-tRNA(Asn)/Glu-tRNA(Gln) amidotransferase A subunit family amidase
LGTEIVHASAVHRIIAVVQRLMNDASATPRLAESSTGAPLNEWPARTIVSAIRDRRLTAVAVMEACLERIAAREPQVKAWSFLDADLSRSPGVSSAGSAAAAVDSMVPLALGTQHTASTTLPASFCGAFGFKPSFGFTSMRGSNVLVPRMAHVGLLARSVDDFALFAGAFDGRLAKFEPIEHSPGSGVMSMPWSLCGLPTLSLPLLRGANGLPIGVQLIGRRGGDRSLLRAAAWPTDATTTLKDVSSHEQA